MVSTHLSGSEAMLSMGTLLFWMKQGVVDPWIPADRWESPPRREAKESPETEWFFVDRSDRRLYRSLRPNGRL